MLRFFTALALATALTQSATAAPFSITQAMFSGSETVVDFNAIGNTTPITNQFAGSGVTFGGALVGLTSGGDTALFNGSTIASNWIYSGPGNTGSVWTATFNSIQNLVGFFVETNTADDVTIEALLGAASIGSLNYPNPNGTTADFIGLGDIGGFDSIRVTTANNFNGFFAMDDFRFESNAATVPDVPEPTSMALFGLTALGMGFAARRRRRKGKPIAADSPA